MVRELASVASVPQDLVFSYVRAQNQILCCETFEEYLLGIILVVRLKVIGLWCDCFSSSKLAVFLKRQGCGSAPVRKDLGQLLCGSPLEGFYFGVLQRSPTCHIIFLVKVKILSLLHACFVLIDIGKVILGFGFRIDSFIC